MKKKQPRKNAKPKAPASRKSKPRSTKAPVTLEQIGEYLDALSSVIDWQNKRLNAIYSEVNALRGEVALL